MEKKVTGQERLTLLARCRISIRKHRDRKKSHPSLVRPKKKPKLLLRSSYRKKRKRKKRVSEFVNKFNRIGDMMKAVKSVTGKDYDIDLKRWQSLWHLRPLQSFTKQADF